MPFDNSPRVIYQENPLEEVACELRFPTLLKLEAELPLAFQERFRGQYPEYGREELELLAIPEDIKAIFQSITPPFARSGITHKFTSSDGKRTVKLGTRHQQRHSYLTLAVRDYKRWEQFRDQLSELADFLIQEYKPDSYSRVGLRYIDKITREGLGLSNESWDKLLKAPISGLLGVEQVGNAVLRSSTVTQIDLSDEVDGARMQVRLNYRGDPADEGDQFLIDVDCFINGKVSHEQTYEILDRFHGVAGRFFRWAITETTQNALKPQPLGERRI